MSGKFQSILLGGAVMGLITSFLPLLSPFLGCLFCLFIPAAGAISIWHFRSNDGEPIQAGPGAGMGAMAGIVAGVIGGIVGWILTTTGLAPDQQEMMQQMMEMMGANADDVDMEQFQQEPSAAMMIVSFVGGLILYSILGAIGGAIGASIWGKGDSA